MSTKLYVGNLSFNTTEGQLNDLFAHDGTGKRPADAVPDASMVERRDCQRHDIQQVGHGSK